MPCSIIFVSWCYFSFVKCMCFRHPVSHALNAGFFVAWRLVDGSNSWCRSYIRSAFSFIIFSPIFILFFFFYQMIFRLFENVLEMSFDPEIIDCRMEFSFLLNVPIVSLFKPKFAKRCGTYASLKTF